MAGWLRKGVPRAHKSECLCAALGALLSRSVPVHPTTHPIPAGTPSPGRLQPHTLAQSKGPSRAPSLHGSPSLSVLIFPSPARPPCTHQALGSTWVSWRRVDRDWGLTLLHPQELSLAPKLVPGQARSRLTCQSPAELAQALLLTQVPGPHAATWAPAICSPLVIHRLQLPGHQPSPPAQPTQLPGSQHCFSFLSVQLNCLYVNSRGFFF